MKKNLKFMFVTLISMLVILALSSCSKEPLKYEENDDGTYTVYANADNCNGMETITIPDTYNGKPVTIVGEGAFKGCTTVKNIILGNNITKICNYAFNCDSLISLTIPPSLKEIEPYAPANSMAAMDYGRFEALEAIYIEDMTAWCNIDLGPCMFNNKTKLYLYDELVTEVLIPEGVTSIKKFAFKGYAYLESVDIPESVISIKSSAFEDCHSLERVYFADSTKWKSGKYYISQNDITDPYTAANYLLREYYGYWEKRK